MSSPDDHDAAPAPADHRQRKIDLATTAMSAPWSEDKAERARLTAEKEAAHAVLFGEAMADLSTIARSLDTLATEVTRIRRDGLTMKGGR